MLDELPLEVVARIGELGRWNERTFLALSQVSMKYQNTVQGLRLYAQRFDLRSGGPTDADAVSFKMIVRRWFTNWETYNPHLARRLGSIAYSLTVDGYNSSIADEDVSALGEVHNLTLDHCY